MDTVQRGGPTWSEIELRGSPACSTIPGVLTNTDLAVMPAQYYYIDSTHPLRYTERHHTQLYTNCKGKTQNKKSWIPEMHPIEKYRGSVPFYTAYMRPFDVTIEISGE